MRYEWNGRAYDTRGEMLTALAREWREGHGLGVTPEATAAECAAVWRLDASTREDPSHAKMHGYSLADLAAEFRKFGRDFSG
jgi:hypothetical protein